MACTYIGIDPSKGAEDITVRSSDSYSSATGKAIELCVDTAKITSRAEIAALVGFLKDRIETVAL